MSNLMIAVIFGFHFNFIAAANPTDAGRMNEGSECLNCVRNTLTLRLGPVTPTEATFSDEIVNEDFSFAPTTPAEASFDDGIEPATTMILGNIAPQTPAEADFND